jgi:hypothetical protein
MKHLPYLTHLKSALVSMQKRMASLKECQFHRDLVATCALNGYEKAGNDFCYCKEVVCLRIICYYLIQQRSQHSCNSVSVDRIETDKFKIGNKYDSDENIIRAVIKVQQGHEENLFDDKAKAMHHGSLILSLVRIHWMSGSLSLR